MLDKSDPLSDLNLLLLGELTGGPRHVGGRIVELGRRHVALLPRQILVIVLKCNTRAKVLDYFQIEQIVDF